MSETKPLIIAHFMHPQHPLTLENGGSYFCNGCQKKSSKGGTRYRCTACEFDLDVACAMSTKSNDLIMSSIVPSVITNNFRHHNHPLTLQSGQDSYRCNGCGNVSSRGGIRYHCTTCDFDLDWLCAISSLSKDYLNMSSSVPSSAPSVVTGHFSHPKHQLKLHSDHNAYCCNGCGKVSPEGGTRYSYRDCDFNLDWSCTTIDQNMSSRSMPHVIKDHFRHHRHPLTLLTTSQGYRCNSCGETSPGGGTVYRCTVCDFDLDWFCALSSHPLYLTPENPWFCKPPYYPVCFNTPKCTCDWYQNQNQNQYQNQNHNHNSTASSSGNGFVKRFVESLALHYAINIMDELMN